MLKSLNNLEEDFGPWLNEENGIAYLSEVMKAEGMSRRAIYNLEVLKILIENDKEEVFKRIPPEIFGGLSGSGPGAIKAFLVARANESAVRQDHEPVEGETIAPFILWDAAEEGIKAYFEKENCWSPDILEDAKRKWGEEISHGNESHVFRYDGSHVAKVMSILMDPQETLDRIAIHNTLYPETHLEVIGFGKDKEGCLHVVVKQQFIEGTSVNESKDDEKIVNIDSLDTFNQITTGDNEMRFVTPNLCVWDFNDRNIIRNSVNGKDMVIDFEACLNIPEKGMGGQWIIPEVEGDLSAMKSIHSALRNLLPSELETHKLLPLIQKNNPGFIDEWKKTGRYPAPVSLPTKDGLTNDFIVQDDPQHPGTVLVTSCSKAFRLIKYDERFSEKEKAQLSQGHTVPKDGKEYNYSLDKGRVLEKTKSKLILKKALKFDGQRHRF